MEAGDLKSWFDASTFIRRVKAQTDGDHLRFTIPYAPLIERVRFNKPATDLKLLVSGYSTRLKPSSVGKDVWLKPTETPYYYIDAPDIPYSILASGDKDTEMEVLCHNLPAGQAQLQPAVRKTTVNALSDNFIISAQGVVILRYSDT